MRIAGAIGLFVLLCCAAPLVAAPPAVPAAERDQYGGWRRYWGSRTGYFHVEELRGRYWLIDPEGNVFLCRSFALPAQADPALISSLAFNAASPAVEGVPFTISLDLGTAAVEAGARATGDFPDVFDPAFARQARERAQAVCSRHVTDPWLIGYFTDSRLGWAPREEGLLDLIDGYLRLPDEAPGRRQVLALLSARYEDDVSRFNEAWGLAIGAFAELGRGTPLRVGRSFDAQATVADRSSLLSAIIERYLQVTAEAVREVDKNHLVLGPVFAEWVPREAPPALGKWVDVVSLRAPVYPPPMNLIGQVYRDCGKPLLIAGFYGGQTEKDYYAYLQRLAGIPFVLGYEWLGPAPQTSTGVRPDLPPLSSRLREVIAAANRTFYEQADRGRLKPAVWQIDRSYEVARAQKPVTVDGLLADWECSKADVMELARSPYCRGQHEVTAQAYLMWDDGHVYVGGKVVDPKRVCPTLTQAVGADWLELQAGPYSYTAVLRPGAQAADRDDKVRIASRGITAGKADEILGYAYEAAVKVPLTIPVGFRFNCGITLHHYTLDGDEVCLSFPANYTKFDPKTTGQVEVVGPR